MLLSKHQILAAADLPFEMVDIPEWGGSVRVQTMTGRQRDKLERLVADKTPHVRAAFACFSVVDDKGMPIFTEADFSELSEKSGSALDRIVLAAKRVSKMTVEDLEHLIPGDLETLKKNSSPTLSDATASDSPNEKTAPSTTSSTATPPRN